MSCLRRVVARRAPLVAVITLAGVVGVGVVPRTVPAQSLLNTWQNARQSRCAALGTYYVGPRVGPAPLHPSPPRSDAASSQAQSAQGSEARGAVPIGMLRGDIVIVAYSGCGQSTMGTFSVYRLGPRVPVAQPGAQPGIAGAPALSPIAALSLRGTFAQSSMQTAGSSATAVTLNVTATVMRQTTGRSRPCPVGSAGSRCMQTTTNAITSTVTATGITGTVQVRPDQGTVTLSFVLPPTASTGASVPMTLYGSRYAHPIETAPQRQR